MTRESSAPAGAGAAAGARRPRGVLLRDAAASLRRRPLRTTLVFLTFALGFTSALVTVGTVDGGSARIRGDLENLGPDMIAALNPVRFDFATLFGAAVAPIDRAVLAELASSELPGVRQVVPISFELVIAARAPHTRPTLLMATESGFADLMRTGVLAGRFFRAGETHAGGAGAGAGAGVAVLDEALARDLSPDDPAAMVGEEITITRGGVPARALVLGVMRDPITLRRHLDVYDTQSAARSIGARRLEFRNVYVPISPRDSLSGVLVQAESLDAVDALAPRVERFFEERKLTPFLHVQKLWTRSLVDMVARFSSVLQFIWVLDLVAVLILVGTISLLAIEERFGEIALRRVEGARIRDVALPVLLDGAILGALALPAGYALARLLLAKVVEPLFGWESLLVPEKLAWLAPLFVGVAVLANGLPAWRVARLAPAAVLGERAQI
ncbi:MAG: ABC transporter permease [Planctomycetes bacterium]|nr:ABC transporter permease [Planctomycetota bacterium]